MTPPAAALLARLAAAHGVPPPAVPGTNTNDLAGTELFALDEAWLHPEPVTSAELAQELAAAAGIPGGATTFARDLASLRAVILAHGRARHPGRTRCLVVGDADYGSAPITRHATGDFAAATKTLAGMATECALLVVEPWLPEASDATALRALLAAARAHGIPIVCDEERTAARAAATTVHAELGLGADFVVFGPSLAAGLPFAATVGATRLTGDATEPVAASIAAAFLRAGGGRVVAHALARLGTTLRDATTAVAAREQLQFAWRGPVTMPQLVWADQEGAPAALIDQHFAIELAALGWRVQGPLCFSAALRRGDAGPMCAAFDRALARIRVKLIEYNSYLSGGVAFAWPGGDATLRARGVCLYRYPRLAAVRVAPVPDGPGMRIDFAAGALGAVTSSGFYVPTLYDGDVEVVARYVLQRWHAGPDSACLGLFLQNTASSARYYAQVMSTADRPLERRVAAGLAGHVHARHPAPHDSGWLRLARTGGTLTASWRADAADAWTQLGSCAATRDPIFVGAKIWSKVATDGLVADLVALQITGTPAAVQEPLLGPVPDPRG